MREIEIAQQDGGKRLESFLKKQFPIGYVRKLFRKNGVRVNGQRGKPEDLVHVGDRVQLYIPFAAQPPTASPRNHLAIVFEDQEIIVVDKPAGLAVHEAKGILRRETAIGQLEAQLRAQRIQPRLVHRIDRDTSGLLLVAKHEQAAQDLEAHFENRNVEKIYLALVAGRLPQTAGTIDLPLPGRDEQLVPAVTHYQASQRFNETTLVEARIDTGRMHQIRLHFAKLGYPVVMDEQHGDFAFNRIFRKEFGLKRQFLHAAKLSLVYRGKKRVWSAPLPQDLAAVLDRLSTQKQAR